MKESVQSGPIYIGVELPDLTAYGMKKFFREALDKMLRRHHKLYMVRHFTSDAYRLYAAEYGILAKRSDDYGQRKATPSSKRAREQDNKAASQMAKLPNLDKANNRPIFKTGRTRKVAIAGSRRTLGKVDFRRLKVTGLPHYVKYVPNVFRALEAVAPDEIQADLEYLGELTEEHFEDV